MFSKFYRLSLKMNSKIKEKLWPPPYLFTAALSSPQLSSSSCSKSALSPSPYLRPTSFSLFISPDPLSHPYLFTASLSSPFPRSLLDSVAANLHSHPLPLLCFHHSRRCSVFAAAQSLLLVFASCCCSLGSVTCRYLFCLS